MNRKAQTIARSLVILFVISAGAAIADEYEIGWFAVGGGGGGAVSTGGDFELTGSVGRPDAGTMSGGDFDLNGGFWALPPCWCMSDVNNDGRRNGEDIQEFLTCMLSAGPACACADLETNGILNMADVAAFVDGLLYGGTCP